MLAAGPPNAMKPNGPNRRTTSVQRTASERRCALLWDRLSSTERWGRGFMDDWSEAEVRASRPDVAILELDKVFPFRAMRQK
jgi:hypothetical protein